MTLRNFDTPLDIAGVTKMTKPAVQVATHVQVTSEVTVVPKRSEARGFVAKQDATTWEWNDLRDFVVTNIESRFGAFPRDMKKEAGIFKAFLARHGDQSPAIARYAFDTEGGYWGGAPISVNRFCKASDPYFADKIVIRLVDTAPSGW